MAGRAALASYMQELRDSEVDFLDKDKEKELFLRFQAGDSKAKEIIIKSHLPFVIHLAKKTFRSHPEDPLFLDLIQAGNEGLAKELLADLLSPSP